MAAAVVRALDAHPHCAPVQAQGCAALALLADSAASEAVAATMLAMRKTCACNRDLTLFSPKPTTARISRRVSSLTDTTLVNAWKSWRRASTGSMVVSCG